jgi:D-xylose transport system substrate-binding protein
LLGKDPDNPASKEFREGQMKALQPLIDRGDIQIAASQWFTSPVTPSTVMNKVGKILESEGKKPLAILASDQELVERANQALEKAGLSRKVPVAGLGDDLATCRRIVSGTQALTVYFPPKKLAEETAYLSAKLARKATQFDCQFVELDNGAGKVQAVLLSPVAVDAKNLDSTILRDQVQRKEDVYGK